MHIYILTLSAFCVSVKYIFQANNNAKSNNVKSIK